MKMRVAQVGVAYAAVAGVAVGDVVKVEMEGTVTTSGSLHGKPVLVGFQYDSDWARDSSDGTTTFYSAQAPLSFMLDAEAWTDATRYKQLVRPTSSLYRMEWASAASPHTAELTLEFWGGSGALTDPSLPSATELAGLLDPVLGSFHPDGGDLVSFSFDAKDVRIVAVPLPPAAWAGLAGLGVVGLMGAARRRRLAG